MKLGSSRMVEVVLIGVSKWVTGETGFLGLLRVPLEGRGFEDNAWITLMTSAILLLMNPCLRFPKT